GVLTAFTLPGIKTPAPLPGTVQYVSQGTITTTSTPSGLTQDVAQFSLSFSGAGTVSAVQAVPGQAVKAGQVLATITSPTFQASLTADQTALQTALVNLAKVEAPPLASSVAS